MDKRKMLWLLTAAMAWRLLLIGLTGPLIYPDSLAYENLAQNIRSGNGYIDTRPQQVMDASLIRTPGYPLFMAAIQALFPQPRWFLILFQQMLGTLTVWLVFRLGLAAGEEKAGIAAAWLVAFHPWLAISGNMIMTETLFTFLLVLSAAVLIAGVRKRSDHGIAAAGCVFGISVLVRPAFLLFLLLLPLVLFFWLRKPGPALRHSLFFTLAAGLVMLPWITWNRVHKGYTGLAAFSGINLLSLVQPPPGFYAAGDPFQEALRASCAQGRGELPALVDGAGNPDMVYREVTMSCTYQAVSELRARGFSQAAIDAKFFSLAARYILSHPAAYLKGAAVEMARLWSGYPLEWLGRRFSRRLPQDREAGDRWIWRLKATARFGLGALLLLGTAWGASRVFRKRSALLIPLALIVAITLTCGLISAAMPRYRLPAEPFIILIICMGIGKKPAQSR